MNTALLKALCQTPGIPGREERVRELIEKEIARPAIFDEITTDPMGNLICRRGPRGSGGKGSKGGKAGKGKATKVLLLCHMDEIGFYVRHIDDKGYIRVASAGGFDTRNLFSRRVKVIAHTGDYQGVMNPGGKPVHIASEADKKKIPEITDLIVDIGLPADEVKKKIRIGDFVVYDDPFVEIGKKLVSKSMDNRVACWLGIESIRQIEKAKTPHDCEIYVVFTTQEEVGLRGAKTSAHTVGCDIGIGLDVTLSCETPGVPADEAVTEQGKGFGLHIMDSSFIADYQLINDIEACAIKHKIPYQRTILMRGGQDGAAAQQAGSGSRAVGIVVGTRYIHTTAEMIDGNDLAAARDILAAWIPTL